MYCIRWRSVVTRNFYTYKAIRYFNLNSSHLARRLHSIKDQNKIGIRDSFTALKYVPRFFVEIMRSSPKLFVANLLSRLLTATTPIVILWVGKLIIDEIIVQVASSVPDYNLLWQYVAIELFVVIMADVINRVVSLTDGLIGDLYSNASSIKIIKKTNELSISQLEDPTFYDKLERARSQTNGRVNLMSNALSQIQDSIVVGSLVIGLIYFEPWLVLLLILSIIPAFINEYKFSSRQYSLARSWTAERRELDYVRYIAANNTTAKEIKLFGLTDYLAERFRYLSDKYYHLNKKLAIKRSAYGTIFSMLGTASYYGAYVLIIYRVINGVITIGDLTFLSGSFNRLQSKLQGMFSKFTRISQNALYLKDYFDFLDLQPLFFDKDKSREIPVNIQEGFRFEDVTFAYPGSEEKVLKGVTFTLNVGEKMAFVGENGAGKTTLIKLLLRFYEPTSGAIYLDGINIKEFDIQAYQKIFGVIFQDFVRYEFTVKENISVGDIEQRDNLPRIRSAAESSLASDVIKGFRNGLDQQLGKRFSQGKELSGGQWQKIALARAYMKDANVIILDEPTAALDARAEFEAFQRFIGLTEGKTSVIISHRFSTVRMADRIVVLHQGRILEHGTHQGLMYNDKLYAELFKLQAAGYQ